MRRLGKATEVADTVAFLCSPGAGYLSGVVVPLDGGMAARRIV
jgi:NAD(P)-dependent dehydrogenase (short-subunit alcohol dehydrogenase family)